IWRNTQMEASANTSCSNVTVTNGFLIRLVGSLGAVSVATCLVALCWLFYLKLYKQFLYRLAAYQVMGSMLHALFLVCQFTFLEYDDSKYPSCVAVGYLLEIAGWMKACFGCWITFHLFCFAVFLKNMKKLEPLYVISSILVPIVVSSVPLITKSYGPTDDWCWIQRKKCGKYDLTGFVEQIALWYGPTFVLLVVQSIAMLIIMITMYYRAHRKSDDDVIGSREQNKKALRQLLPLMVYPVVFCILIIPPLIERLYGFSPVPRGLLILVTVCIPAWSFFAGVSLIVHIGAIRRTDVIACICTPLACLSRTFQKKDYISWTSKQSSFDDH
ncbi:hypothetical protein EMCRGX_G009298, partial [Ephydatia muelleri]